jgi:hypothetical protein
MLSNEFKINKVYKFVYVKNINKSYVIVYLYVDDMLILGGNNYMIKSTNKSLTNKFDMKNLDVSNVILVLKISRTYNGLVLSQSHHIEKILVKFFKGDNNIMKTPKDISVHLSKNKGKEIYQLEYSQILEIRVGSLKNNKNGTQIFEVHIGL